MKNKTGISLIMMLLIVISTFTVVGSPISIKECVVCGYIDFDKTVWDGEGWVETVDVLSNDNVRFNITLTYHKDPYNTNPWTLHKIKIKDVLPDSLVFANDVSMMTTGSSQIEYTEEVIGNEIYWNFTDNKPELADGESLYIEFSATVLESYYGMYYNCAEVTAKENCQYTHEDSDCAAINILLPDSTFEKKVKNIETGEWDDESLGILGEKMYFKLEYSYYGNDVLTDIRFEDKLPCVLEISNNITWELNKNFSISVSEDGKTIWFNLSEDEISDCDIVYIIFSAYVTGITGDCCPNPAKNKAWLFVYDPIGQIIDTFYDEVQVTTFENHIPCPPIISGPYNGAAGEVITFEIRGYDPDDDKIFYYIEWGDESYEEWIGPYSSGEVITITHAYETEGEYTVKAVAKDVWDYIGYYGNELFVTIKGEAPPDLQVSIKGGLGRSVKVSIKNNKETVLYNIEWKVTIDKKLIGKTKVFNVTIESIAPGEMITVGGSQFGLGRIKVYVNVSGEGINPILKNADGFIIFKFIRLRKYF